MLKFSRGVSFVSGVLSLAVIGFAPVMTAHAAPLDAAQMAAGEKAFAQCKACHNLAAAAKDSVGPNLYGVYGTKAGAHSTTFKYSAAMKASGLTWDDATLDTFLSGPTKAVPGTKMAYRGVTDPATRKALIYYIKAQSAK
ncbi:c-type cytochrome [Asticcacaulis sp. 201]|uniref:c-type cytochrome n=1 Tax=Asticcacaulis sp. 201 TaxID=3028787 RepID=UPI002915C58A|nr:c-type cytochrome [Asticcacaulis sp. 201]MDV6331946.1 c-type cytochrome [Asticcacaulis sp. 201]